MALSLNPFRLLAAKRGDDAAELYGAIVAQARLPVFYQALGVPDRIEGRFLVLSINLFAVLNRLTQDAPATRALSQALSDRFSADMETVLRELGVGDLAIPKKMRALAASSRALLQAYAGALPRGEEAVAAELARAFPFLSESPQGATRRLAHYLMMTIRALEAQPLAALARGEVNFPEDPGEEPND